MIKKYYLYNGSENIGPLDLEDLKTQQLTKETPIWYDGIEDWTAAGEIDELKSVVVVAPPVFVKKEKEAFKDEVAGTAPKIAEQQKTSIAWKIIRAFLIGFLIVIAVAFVASIIDKNSSPSPYEIELTAGEKEAMYPTDYLHAGGTYKPNFLGDKLKITGFVENKATLTTYKDIVIEIIYYSKTDTPLKTVYHTVYEFVPPSRKQPFELKIENYNNVGSLGWKVYNAGVK